MHYWSCVLVSPGFLPRLGGGDPDLDAAAAAHAPPFDATPAEVEAAHEAAELAARRAEAQRRAGDASLAPEERRRRADQRFCRACNILTPPRAHHCRVSPHALRATSLQSNAAAPPPKK